MIPSRRGPVPEVGAPRLRRNAFGLPDTDQLYAELLAAKEIASQALDVQIEVRELLKQILTALGDTP